MFLLKLYHLGSTISSLRLVRDGPDFHRLFTLYTDHGLAMGCDTKPAMSENIQIQILMSVLTLSLFEPHIRDLHRLQRDLHAYATN